MQIISIHSNREATVAASKFISENRSRAYLGWKKDFDLTYYNVNGIVWQVWQSGCGHYPTSVGVKAENFNLDTYPIH